MTNGYGKFFLKLFIILIILAFLLIGMTLWFNSFYQIDAVRYSTYEIPDKYYVMNPGDTFKVNVARCADGDFDIAAQSFLAHAVETDNEAGVGKERILLNISTTTVQEGCIGPFLGFERTIPLETEPDSYTLITEITYKVELLWWKKKEALQLETDTFFVTRPEINGNGASTEL